MQGRWRRRLVPAIVALVVHAALLSGFLGLRPKPQPLSGEQTLPIALIDRPRPPVPLPTAPGPAPSLRVPYLSIAIPEVPTPDQPAAGLPAPLGDYIACGLGKLLTEEERAKCEATRLELYALPGRAPSPDYDLALARRFSRDKALQDHPLLRVCYRRMGPDPLCFTRGFELLYGSVAARDSIPLPLGGPAGLR